jgi:hypothetical protein
VSIPRRSHSDFEWARWGMTLMRDGRGSTPGTRDITSDTVAFPDRQHDSRYKLSQCDNNNDNRDKRHHVHLRFRVFTPSPHGTLLATYYDLPCRPSGNKESVMDLVQDSISIGRSLIPWYTWCCKIIHCQITDGDIAEATLQACATWIWYTTYRTERFTTPDKMAVRH